MATLIHTTLIHKIARLAVKAIPPELISRLVADEVKNVMAKQTTRPAFVNYDPHGEGFRPVSGVDGTLDSNRRDIRYVDPHFMFEMAYFLHKMSGLTRRFVADTRNFCVGSGVTYSVDNDPDGSAKQVLDDFWSHSVNKMKKMLPDYVLFLSLLGVQCIPASVNKRNGRVYLGYIDPANIHDVTTLRDFPQLRDDVIPLGAGGSGKGKPKKVIREELDPREPGHGRMVGECFYWTINNAPNEVWGWSDLLHLFDFIQSFERGLIQELDRLQDIRAYIWDVTLNGYNDEEIQNFLKNQTHPQPGSIRAHNEGVAWKAEAPTLNTADNRNLYELMRSYFAATLNRPDSWFGGGGKAYANEADSMQAPTYKDLEYRQLDVRYMLWDLCAYAVDQAVIHGTIPDRPYIVKIEMPEMSDKGLIRTVNSLVQLSNSLVIGENQSWVSHKTAARLYLNTAQKLGIDIDAAEEIKNAAKDPDYTEDTARELAERLKGRKDYEHDSKDSQDGQD